MCSSVQLLFKLVLRQDYFYVILVLNTNFLNNEADKFCP